MLISQHTCQGSGEGWSTQVLIAHKRKTNAKNFVVKIMSRMRKDTGYTMKEDDSNKLLGLSSYNSTTYNYRPTSNCTTVCFNTMILLCYYYYYIIIACMIYSVLACIHVLQYANLNIIYIIQVPCIITLSTVLLVQNNREAYSPAKDCYRIIVLIVKHCLYLHYCKS